eukprot:4284668-Amphidinium_carterae.1
MGTEYKKDPSHLGAMAKFGDELNATQMGVEPMHTSDFGNKLYTAVIYAGHLSKYDDWTAGRTFGLFLTWYHPVDRGSQDDDQDRVVGIHERTHL